MKSESSTCGYVLIFDTPDGEVRHPCGPNMMHAAKLAAKAGAIIEARKARAKREG